MLGAIYIGLSGMDAYQKGLQTISNNVANLNTPGFKATSVSFSDLFSYGGGGLSYALGGSDRNSGDGVSFGPSTTDFTQGDLRASDNNLDLAIQGSGFLVLLDGDKTYYSRTGQFVVDKNGYITQQGTDHRLGVLDSDGRAVALQIDSKRINPPVATTTIKFSDNLPAASDATVSDLAVYDSAGTKHVWTVRFTRDTTAGASGTWIVSVTDDKGVTVSSVDPKLKFIGSIVDPSTSKLSFTGTSSDGNKLDVTLDFSGSVTSFSAGTSTLRAASVDGHAIGTLSTVTVDEDGHVKLTYSNSETDVLGAVAIADFRDMQQLKQVGNGLFENRGAPPLRLSASGTDGIGTLKFKQIEASNVDLSQEFGQLILIQRGFQASSQVVSVSNDMIQQLFGIRGQG